MSQKAYAEAIKYIPGGVNSPVRALKSVGSDPLFIQKADGVVLTDIDQNQYIDFCLSWGVFIQGHNHPVVAENVKNAVEMGTSYGIPTLLETELAKKVVDSIPSVEKVRFVSSGTEAVMSAIRVARGYTGKNIIVKFDGCYHGHADHLLVAAGSGVATLHSSSSSGVPEAFTQYTLSIPFNDIEAVKKVFENNADDIAAIIVEPVPANMGVVPAKAGFLEFLREITLQYNALLIFDEVISGFRLGLSGAQGIYNIQPDLTTIGKIIGGGFPAAAFGGKTEIMSVLAPEGPVYQAGTLSGNPIAMTAGISVIQLMTEANLHQQVNEKSEYFISKLKEIVANKPIVLNHIGSMFTLFFTKGKIENFEDVKASNTDEFARFFKYLLSRGIYFSPSAYEASFISAAHSYQQLDYVLQTIADFFREN